MERECAVETDHAQHHYDSTVSSSLSIIDLITCLTFCTQPSRAYKCVLPPHFACLSAVALYCALRFLRRSSPLLVPTRLSLTSTISKPRRPLNVSDPTYIRTPTIGTIRSGQYSAAAPSLTTVLSPVILFIALSPSSFPARAAHLEVDLLSSAQLSTFSAGTGRSDVQTVSPLIVVKEEIKIRSPFYSATVPL